VLSTSLNFNFVINLDAPRNASASEHAHAVCASIRSGLEADGLVLNDILAASNTTTVAGVVRRASIRRASSQDVPGDTSLDYVRGIALPWMHRLRPVWGSIVEAVSHMSDHTRSASNTPVMAAVVGLGFFAAQGQGIPVMYTAGTLALFALRNPYGLFKSPDVPHFITVIDFFDKEVQVPVSETNSWAVRQALFCSPSLLSANRRFTVP